MTRLNERGFALVVVLWVLALFLVVVTEFARTMRLEAETTRNYRDGVTAAHLAEAGHQRALAELLPDALAHELDLEGRLVFRRSLLARAEAPVRTDLALGRGRFSYRISDEESRIHLNRAAPVVLDRLLAELGVDKLDRDGIVDSILDWRDPNDEHRLNGAESDYYLGLPVPYRAKNGDFDSVEELGQVKGVTPELLHGSPGHPGLAEFLTVAGSGRVNLNTASPTVLRALGFAQAEVDQIVQGRPFPTLQQIPTFLRRGAQRVKSETFRIEAWGEVPGQGRQSLLAIVTRQVGSDGVPRGHVRAWRWEPPG